WIMAHAMRHPDLFESAMDAFFALYPAHLAIGERQLDVFVHREITNQVEALEDETDLLVADACAVGKVEALHRLAVQDIGAVGRRVEEADDRQQRRFA